MPTIPISPAISQCENDEPPTALTLALPRRRHLKQLWAVMADDHAFHQYSDLFPRTARTAQAALARGTMRLWVVLDGATPVGWWSIHDRSRGADGQLGAWLGCFFVPGSRGRIAVRSFPLFRDLLQSVGLHRLFVAIKQGNRQAQWFASRVGFRRVGTYERFTQFGGTWGNVILYTQNAADIGFIWQAAHNRALTAQVLVGLAPPPQ